MAMNRFLDPIRTDNKYNCLKEDMICNQVMRLINQLMSAKDFPWALCLDSRRLEEADELSPQEWVHCHRPWSMCLAMLDLAPEMTTVTMVVMVMGRMMTHTVRIGEDDDENEHDLDPDDDDDVG